MVVFSTQGRTFKVDKLLLFNALRVEDRNAQVIARPPANQIQLVVVLCQARRGGINPRCLVVVVYFKGGSNEFSGVVVIGAFK